MAEEQRCGEGHRLCANNCGLFGSPATLNLCSKCYGDYRHKDDHHASSATITVDSPLVAAAAASTAAVPIADSGDVGSPLVLAPPPRPPPPATAEEEKKPAAAAAQAPGRCASCRKRVGLVGFTCRCGSTFCGAHRYAERHACTFDFKAAGRDAIARANPLVKADKLGRKI